MNDLQVFKNTEFGEVRTIEIDGKPYFMASDVASSLGYAKPNNAVSLHCRATLKQGIEICGRMQEVNFITEGDVYRLISKSQLPSAEKFESWVFDEVLPSIRKNGGYIAGQEKMSDSELMAKALMVAQKTIDTKNELIAMQDSRIQGMVPKEIFADAVATSHTSILVFELAKILRQNGINIGGQRLFIWLRENGYLVKRKGTDWNMPTQKAMELELFEIKESTHIDGNGCNVTTKTPKVTGKGQVYFVNKFLRMAV